MTTITSSAVRTTTASSSIWRRAVIAGLSASAATSVVAAVAHAAGVSLNINGEPIPVSGFATLTLLFTTVGFGLAVAVRRWAGNPRRTFIRTTVALTALSFLPDLLVSGAAAETRVSLMVTHLVAAAMFIPAIASRLPEGRS
jgi:hypothetical protein